MVVLVGSQGLSADNYYKWPTSGVRQVSGRNNYTC